MSYSINSRSKMAAAPDEASVSVKTEPELLEDVKQESPGCNEHEETVACNGVSLKSPSTLAAVTSQAGSSEAPDRQTLLAVLQFLKKSNLKESADVLLRETGIVDGGDESPEQQSEQDGTEQTLLSRVTAGNSSLSSGGGAANSSGSSAGVPGKGEEMLQQLQNTIKEQMRRQQQEQTSNYQYPENETLFLPTFPSSESRRMDLWTTAGVKLLIVTYSEYAHCFQSAKYKKKDVWHTISERLQEHGYNVTGEQCNNKWKLLMKQYKNVVDNNAKSGRSRISCRYYDELEEALGRSKEINPQITLNNSEIITNQDEESMSSSCSETPGPFGATPISSLLVHEDKSLVNSQDPFSGLSGTTDDKTRPTECPTPVRKRMRPLPSADKISAYLQHCKQVEEAKERRHNEKLEVIRQNNALLQRLIDKL